MDEPQVFRHPEWKRLYDCILPLCEVGRLFSHEEIKAMMDLDPRTARGRNQFHRCAKEIAKNHLMQFESVRGKGYRVVEASENTSRMHNRMGRAKRQISNATFIGLHTAIEQLTEEQRRANADILARLGRLASAISADRREARKVIVAAEPKRLPHPLLN